MVPDGPSDEECAIKADSASKPTSTPASAFVDASGYPEGAKLKTALVMIILSAFLYILATSTLRSNVFTVAAPAGDIIDTGYAKYLGNRSFPNTVAYLGVPYAEPPLGNLRFRAPLPLDKARIARQSKGQVIDATQNPNFCIQGTIGRKN